MRGRRGLGREGLFAIGASEKGVFAKMKRRYAGKVSDALRQCHKCRRPEFDRDLVVNAPRSLGPF